MRIVHCLLAIACLSVAGLAGCADEKTAPIENEATPATTVTRYTAEDIAALPLGEFVRFDLNVPNAIYALTYEDPSNLDHVLVVRGDDEYVLGDRTTTTVSPQGDVLKQIVISGDDESSGSSLFRDGDAVCNCPCCQLVNGTKVCC